MSLQCIKRYFKNIPGWRTNRKIVLFESDDWGSIRMPSREVYEECLRDGYPVDENPYERYDSLASEKDLELLFSLLGSFKDQYGNHPVFTANVLTSNPDFDKIKETNFREYHYELVPETLKRYSSHKNCFKLWMEAKKKGIFHFQSHGREHLNVSEFMAGLQADFQDLHYCFSKGMPGIVSKDPNGGVSNKYVEALRYVDASDKQQKLSIVLEGLELFEKLFGYRSHSFIPPNYFWSPDFDEAVSKRGVQFYQGNRRMKEIQIDGSKKYRTHHLGKQNRFGQRYLIRNSAFEPSLHKFTASDSVDRCLADISAAFRMKKPAIICTHRLNYVGYIEESNRDKNLKLLKSLIKNIVNRWPSVEFMNSTELGYIIDEDK